MTAVVPPYGYRLLMRRERMSLRDDQEEDLLARGDDGRWHRVNDPLDTCFIGPRGMRDASLASYVAYRHSEKYFAIRVYRKGWVLPALVAAFSLLKGRGGSQ